MASKQAIPFRGSVPAAGELTKRYFLRKPGTIEKVYNRIYSGPTGDLKIYFRLIRQGEIFENILKGDPHVDYVSGDDDRDEYDVTLSFDRGDILEVQGVNADVANAYDLNAVITVDYYGGKRRVI